MNVEVGGNSVDFPAETKEEYERVREQIEKLSARRNELAEKLRGYIEAGCAPDGVKLIPVTKIAITDPYALCEAIGDDLGDLELLEAIIRGAVTINAAKAATLIEKAGLSEEDQARLAAFFSSTVSERLDVR